MRIRAIVQLLTTKELKLLQPYIENRDRDSLSNLWKTVKRASKEEDWEKENLFEKTYGITYTKDKDYLFRNELRILNTILISFIAKTEIETEMDTKQSLNALKVLERMLNVGQTSDFDNLWNDAFRSATEILDYEILSKLMDLKAKWLIKFHEVSVSNYETVAMTIEAEKRYLEKHFQERSHRLEVGQSFAKRVIKAISQSDFKSIKQKKSQLANDSSFENLISYYQKMSKSYLVDGEEKIRLLNELLTLYPTVVKNREELKKDINTLYGNLGLEYFLMNDFENADNAYKKAISLQQKGNFNIEILFNYCVNLLMLSRYKEFINQYNIHNNAIAKNEKLKHRFTYFNAIALMFENKAERAFELLTQDISQRPVNDYYYFRIVYAMVYVQLNDIDNALREVENILQSFRFRKNAPTVDKPLVKLIHRLISAYSLKDQKTKKQKELQKIRDEIKKQKDIKLNTSIVIQRWIVWQLDNLEDK